MTAAEITDTEPVGRRARRRQETIEEILEIAEAIMNEDGVNALSLSEIARRLGVKPPSVYKYFDSLMAIVDALFARGMTDHLVAIRAAMDAAKPGLDSIAAAFDASGRWCVAHSAMAQLMFWRPMPGFEPSTEAMAPSLEMVQLQRDAFADAVKLKQLGAGAKSDEAIWVGSILISGVVGQTLANEPDVTWGKGRFSALLPDLLSTLTALYPPKR